MLYIGNECTNLIISLWQCMLDRHPLSISSEEQRFSITSPLRSKGGGIESGTLGKKNLASKTEKYRI